MSTPTISGARPDPDDFTAAAEPQEAPPIIRAERAWAPPKTKFIHTCDSSEAIQRCLRCTKPPKDCFGTCSGLARRYTRTPQSNRPGGPKRHRTASAAPFDTENSKQSVP